MDRQVGAIVDNTYMLILAIVISNLNRGIKQFFTSEFVMFTTFTLYNFQRNKNILLSLAIAFGMVFLVTIITADMSLLTESFGVIINPTSNTKIGCEKITIKDLVDKFGSEDALKRAMFEALVPLNLTLEDRHAPEIATYLVTTMRAKISDTCV